MRLADYTPRVRRDKVAVALAAALRKIEAPTPTSEIVNEVCATLDTNEVRAVAAILDVIKREHPQARQTGETFERYGKKMQRWEWLPSHKRTHPRLTAEELERRRAKIAADEATDEDPWTVHPAPATGEFLEEDER
jgi:hypothetical protein